MRKLPRGTVTFLFTDIAGSTRLLRELGAERYAELLAEHRRVLRGVVGAWGGVEVDTQGDAFFFAFARAHDAAAAASEAQRILAGGAVRVRVGLHTGEPLVGEEGYVGVDVHRAARLAAAGHGGQVLVSQATRDLLNGLELRSLGEHRLKDLTRPEQVYQLGEGDFPPLKSLNRTNLPVSGSPLIGRERELAELVEAVRGGARLLTLTGPGGSGKTRLALQVAAELADEFAGGVFFVPLAGILNPALVIPAAVQAVDGEGEALEAVLRRRPTLLVLDSFEHLLEAAADVARVLESVAQGVFLVTSRVPLRVAAEQEYWVDPLAEGEAVALFRERGRAVGREVPANATVAQICQRIDRLPLAIELAAARLRLLDPEGLLVRLERRLPLLTGGRRDAPARQRTLEATIAWSYDLLEDEQRQLFRRLSVFAGTFSLDAAEAVADADVDGMEALVEASLVKSLGVDRFLMLETIGEYASDRLAGTEEAAVIERRHADFFLRLAEEAAQHMRQRDERPWLELLDREQDNLRAALAWLRAAGESETEARLTVALRDFFWKRGFIAEARDRLRELLVGRSRLPPPLRARLLQFAGTVLMNADLERARHYAEEWLELTRGLGDRREVAAALNNLGIIALEQGDEQRAGALFSECAEIARSLDDRDLLVYPLANLGEMAWIAGEYERARSCLDEALEYEIQTGDKVGAGVVLQNLAATALLGGDPAQALKLFRRSLVLLDEMRSFVDMPFALDGAAAALVATGHAEEAAVLLGTAEALREKHESRLLHAEQLVHERAVSALRAALDADAIRLQWADGRSIGIERALELAVGGYTVT